mmetsp:Transcript_11027/g.20768  ORF Transcript_11027/g.20768 Transcript_11027/m.20768 type:complete len:186 (+) Transcript_11027:313-870(+)
MPRATRAMSIPTKKDKHGMLWRKLQGALVQTRAKEVKSKAKLASISKPTNQHHRERLQTSGQLALDKILQSFNLTSSQFEEIVRDQHAHGDPNMPPAEPSSSQMRAVTYSDAGFNVLKQAHEFVRPLRAKSGNVVASLMAMADPENCLMKVAYSTYRMDREDEDDYPYFPRNCGDGFRFETGSLA